MMITKHVRTTGRSTRDVGVLARACGHTHLNQFRPHDLTTWKRDVVYLTGVQYGVPL